MGETSYVKPYFSPRRMIRVGALMYGLWLAQNSPKQWKARQSRQNQVYLAFSSQNKNRYDGTLANRRAPGVWFVLGFRMYLSLAPKWPGIPDFGKTLIFIPHEGYRSATPLDATRVNWAIFHNHSVHFIRPGSAASVCCTCVRVQHKHTTAGQPPTGASAEEALEPPGEAHHALCSRWITVREPTPVLAKLVV